MKAVRLHRYGPPEDSLVYEDVPKPVAGPGQVLIRNEAVGLNFADIEQRRNTYPFPVSLPTILGNEFAGTVEALGDGVSGITVGDRVFGVIGGPPAGYAQYVTTAAAGAQPIPAGLSFAESTALLTQGIAAYLLLRDGARVTQGDSVLVLAAAGGVGSLAVQLAKIMGARQVIGAASTAEKRKLVSELGADTVDYSQPHWSKEVFDATGGRGVDVALANVGGELFTEAMGSLAPFGRLRAFGNADKTAPVVNFTAELGAGRLGANQNVGFFSMHSYAADPQRTGIRSALAALVEHAASGRLRINRGLELPLSQAAEAHRLIEDRQTTGKSVLLPWAD